MSSEKFRRQLRQEAERWWTEGWIDAALYEKLAQRYQFREIETAASHRFAAILLGLGGVLLGLGVITFVAANWQEWPRSLRVILLLTLFVGVNGAGFYLWQRGVRRLGEALLLTGALVLGANMALMSQMFHQTGRLYELFGFWGIGVVAMAYSLRLTSLGVLALGLMETSFWVWWFSQWSNQEITWGYFVMRNLALIMAGLFVPLAYWCGSQVLFGVVAIATTTCLLFNLQPLTYWDHPEATFVVAIALTLPPALLWGYTGLRRDGFAGIARGISLVWLGGLFYLFSFGGFWQQVTYSPWKGYGLPWAYLDAVLLSVVTGLGWLQLLYPLHRSRTLAGQSINSISVGLALVVATTLFCLRHQGIEFQALATLGFNALLFLLAVALLRDGLALGQRSRFWGGVGLLVLGITSRMLEYNTGLLLKALVFVLCGVGVIAAGLWFERTAKLPQLVNSHSQEEQS